MDALRACGHAAAHHTMRGPADRVTTNPINNRKAPVNLHLRYTICATALSLLAPFSLAQDAPKAPSVSDELREAVKSQLPPPPDGFVWQVYKNTVFPKPRPWNEREMATASMGIPFTVYSASPEDFSATKPFEMGFTVQIISGSQRIRGIDAKKMAMAYLKPFLDVQKKEDVLIANQSARGDFEQTIFRYRDAPAGLKPVIVHKMILANTVTDSVHVFTFESPAQTWDENWARYGTPILSRINVVPGVAAN